MIPFAVVGSDQEYQVNGRRLLGRKTKWGTIEGTTLVCIYINDALLAKKKRGKKEGRVSGSQLVTECQQCSIQLSRQQSCAM